MMAEKAENAAENAVHGLDGAWTRADWAAWTLEEVDVLLREYEGLGRAVELTAVSPRPFSAAARVRTTVGCVFVKRHGCMVRSPGSLAEEHAFAAWLAARTPLVTAPLRARDGRTTITIKVGRVEWTCEAFPIAPGQDVYEHAIAWTPYRNRQHGRAAGASLAEFHLAAREFAAPARSVAPLVTSYTLLPAADPCTAFAAYLAARSKLEMWLDKQRGNSAAEAVFARWFLPQHERLRESMRNESSKVLQPLWTHNDWHGSNLMWSSAGEDARVTAVVDFGLADRTCAAHDVATAIERCAVDWLALGNGGVPIARVEQAAALLDGYEERVRLTRPERAAIAAMLPIVHCEFALTEMDYFLRVLGDEQRARVAWETYFIGHCAWFESFEGMRWMEWMQAWTEDATTEDAG